MKVLYAKVGTGPGGYVRIKSIRRDPVKGDKVKYKETDCHGLIAGSRPTKWEDGLISGIVTLNGPPYEMYMIEKF
jgi:hypothetical protein